VKWTDGTFRACLLLGVLLTEGSIASAGPRCYPNPRFVARPATQTVYDNLTKLEWQQNTGGLLLWSDANAFCTGGFRLPTLKELVSIVDYAATSGTKLPGAFGTQVPVDVWTSTLSTVSAGEAYIVEFRYGFWQPQPMTTHFSYVRCVR
jgi:hypothetical protein